MLRPRTGELVSAEAESVLKPDVNKGEAAHAACESSNLSISSSAIERKIELFNSKYAGSFGLIPSDSSKCRRVDRSRATRVGRLASSSREFAISRLDAFVSRRAIVL